MLNFKVINKKNINIEDYFPLVKSLAKKIIYKYKLRNNIEFEDLFQSGVVGLIKAGENFSAKDFDRIEKNEIKFKSYLKYKIFGDMIDFIRWSQKDYFNLKNCKIRKEYFEKKRQLSNSLGREPYLSELSNFMNIDIELFLDLKNKSEDFRRCILFSDIEDECVDLNLIASYKTNSFDCLSLKYSNEDLLSNIWDLSYKILNFKELQVLSLYYKDNVSMVEIGELLDISEGRVSQIHINALNKIREKITIHGNIIN